MTFPLLMFTVTKFIALGAWILLFLSLFARGTRPVIWPLTQYWVPALLSACYVVMVWDGRDLLDLPTSFTQLHGIAALYAHPGPLAASWLHFLALDLFVGTWIARDGAERGMPMLLILFCLPFAFILAPAGLLLYLGLRLLVRRRGDQKTA